MGLNLRENTKFGGGVFLIYRSNDIVVHCSKSIPRSSHSYNNYCICSGKADGGDDGCSRQHGDLPGYGGMLSVSG